MSRPSEFHLAQANVALSAACFGAPSMAGMVSRIAEINRLPTIEEAGEMLRLMDRLGPARDAFSFAKPFPTPIGVIRSATTNRI